MRLVITKRNRTTVLLDASGRINQGIPDDSYRERLLKYIPAETIALFIAVYGITYYLSGSEPGTPDGPLDPHRRYPWYSLYLWQVEGVTDLAARHLHHRVRYLGMRPRCGHGCLPAILQCHSRGLLLVLWVFGVPPSTAGRKGCNLADHNPVFQNYHYLVHTLFMHGLPGGYPGCGTEDCRARHPHPAGVFPGHLCTDRSPGVLKLETSRRPGGSRSGEQATRSSRTSLRRGHGALLQHPPVTMHRAWRLPHMPPVFRLRLSCRHGRPLPSRRRPGGMAQRW